jgi:regulation of enolase protein 1 (concanavalin A-like superfamily)
MVRISADCWIKTSVEYEDGSVSRLGCVVTNRGYSDWSTQDIPATITNFALRVTRQEADYLVEAQLPGGLWSQLRMAHLYDDSESGSVRCGVYACSPKEPGFTAEFRNFTLCPR